MIPQQFIDELNHDADLVGLIGRHVALTKKGTSYTGLCPFHDEKTPSFNVVPTKGFFHCFGCGESGSALKFLMSHVHGNDFLAAVQDLASQLGREIPQNRADNPKRNKAYEVLDKMQDFYIANLFGKAVKARTYLKERGLSKATAQRFGMGFAPRDGGFAEAFGEDYNKKLLIEAGLAVDKNRFRPYFRGRIIIPIHSSTGKVVGFGGRALGDQEPKYLNSPQSEVFDKGRTVYGLHLATQGFKEEGCALVVEGYMDVIMLAEYGLNNAVATMGTAATSDQLRAILIRSDRCVFCFDGDNAGRRAAAKALANCMPVLADGKEVQFVFLPQGEDPDSFVRSQSAAALRKLADNAKPLAEMLVSPPELDAENLTASKRAMLWHDAAALIELLDTDKAPFLKEELYTVLSKASEIDVASLKKAANKIKLNRPIPTVVPLKQEQTGHRRMADSPFLRLLIFLAVKPKLVTKLNNVPLFSTTSRQRADQMLCTRVIEAVTNQLAQGGEGDVLGYLAEQGHHGLVLQLKDKAKNWKKGSAKAAEGMDQIIGMMKVIAKQNEDNQRARDELADLSDR